MVTVQLEPRFGGSSVPAASERSSTARTCFATHLHRAPPPVAPATAKADRLWAARLGSLEGSAQKWQSTEANRADRGGLTAYGITFSTFRRLRKNASRAEFLNLTGVEAKRIATQAFSRWYHLDRIANPNLAVFLGDAYWGGQAPAALDRTLKALGQPGIEHAPSLCGVTETLARQLNAVEPQRFVDLYIRERERLHQALGARVNPVTGQQDQRVFVEGWDNRWRSRWIQFKLNTGQTAEVTGWLRQQPSRSVTWQVSRMSESELGLLRQVVRAEPGDSPLLTRLLEEWDPRQPHAIRWRTC